jgi:serine-type D-Ala-D-Ala carboxypeptidase (penicillin-binding protein 5/6)
MKPASLRTTVLIAAVLLLAIAGVNLFRFMNANEPNQAQILSAGAAVPDDRHAYVFPLSETSYIPFLDSSRPRPTLTARAAIVYDMQTSRFLYAQDTKKQLPIASLTKILTAVVTLEQLAMNEIVTVGKGSLKVDGLRQDLYLGEKISVGNLMKMMLIQSSNDAAYALSAHAKTKGLDFMELMNQKAQQLGMDESRFLDPAGLSDNAHSSVQDLAKLVVYALRYNEIWTPLQEKVATVTSEDGKFTHTVENTNQLLGVLPDISGGKTGYTDGALGCMILIVDIPGHKDKIISIILGSKDRFGDTKKLIDWITDAYRWE